MEADKEEVQGAGTHQSPKEFSHFSFTPEKDWAGQDTFTYKLSDGHVDSNLATVTLTVTPVNDAPVPRSELERHRHGGLRNQ